MTYETRIHLSMLSIKLIVISELKSGPWKELQGHYLKLLKPYAHVDLAEIKPEKFSTPAERDNVLTREATKIRKQIPDGAVIVVLDADGKTSSTETFVRTIDTLSDGGRTLCFVIGGPLGLSDKIKKEADHRLSLSPMTFPHDFTRVMLLEQLYRTQTITAGKTYHY